MDAWTDLPGARVEGHRAVVRGLTEASYVRCGCGFTSVTETSLEASCVTLVDHLQAAVRAGARVLFDDGGDAAGVREPRRPLRPLGSLGVSADPEREHRSA